MGGEIDTTFVAAPNACGFLLIISGFAELQASDRALFRMRYLPYDDDEDAKKPEKFKSLSAQEARELRERNLSVPPWKVVLGQGVVGLLVALPSSAARQRSAMFWPPKVAIAPCSLIW